MVCGSPPDQHFMLFGKGAEGANVEAAVGACVGPLVGWRVGLNVEAAVGACVGSLVGWRVGFFDGFGVGFLVGGLDGFGDGILVGFLVGSLVGYLDGASDGFGEGMSLEEGSRQASRITPLEIFSCKYSTAKRTIRRNKMRWHCPRSGRGWRGPFGRRPCRSGSGIGGGGGGGNSCRLT